MSLYPVDQKKPLQKKKELKAEHHKTPRAKFSDPAFPTVDGDLGIMRIQGSDIPVQSRRGPTRTGDSKTNSVHDGIRKIMKRQGMLA